MLLRAWPFGLDGSADVFYTGRDCAGGAYMEWSPPARFVFFGNVALRGVRVYAPDTAADGRLVRIRSRGGANWCSVWERDEWLYPAVVIGNIRGRFTPPFRLR